MYLWENLASETICATMPTAMGDRLVVGQQTLDLHAEVRILVPQLDAATRPLPLAGKVQCGVRPDTLAGEDGRSNILAKAGLGAVTPASPYFLPSFRT